MRPQRLGIEITEGTTARRGRVAGDMDRLLMLEAGWRPGILGRMVELHARHFAHVWGVEARYEAGVARGLATFIERYDPDRDLLLAAIEDDRVVGSVVIDSGYGENRAELRWFIVDTPGKGVGRSMLRSAMAHVDRVGFAECHLSTFQPEEDARRLYGEFGFELASSTPEAAGGAERIRLEFVRTRR